LEVDLEHLENQFRARVGTGARSASHDVFGRASAFADDDDLLDEGSGNSIPGSAAFAAICRRSVLMTLPIVVADLLALCAATWFAHGALHLLLPSGAAAVGWTAPLALTPIIFGFWVSGLYTEIWVHPAVELRQMTHLTTLVLLAAAAGSLLAAPMTLWCVAAWMIAVVLAPLLRTIARRLCANQTWWGYPTLVIANGADADTIARALLRDANTGLRPVLLTVPDDTRRTSLLPVINEPAILKSAVRAKMVRHAVVSLPDLSAAQSADILDRYSGVVPHLLVLSDYSTLPTLWSTSRRCGRLSGIEVRNGLMLVTLQFVKRCIDVTIAVLALTAALPFLALVAILIKRSSPGPLYYGHWRIGRHGRRFKAWKFRTMRVDADAVLSAYLASNPDARVEWNRDHKLRDDPRVTRFGRIARQWSIDEFPQLWNVIRGDMSLVGPRPIIDDEVTRYGDAFLQYASVKPGITGMWQVSGRNDIDYIDRVRLDQFYIRHWSPWLDIYILAKTIVALVSRDGAY
jgi:Undecaprenyl-phosphate galactose phosphotransferase WbaP